MRSLRFWKAAALVSVSLVAVLPTTGWIVRSELMMAMFLPIRGNENRALKVARQHPHDYALQFALAVMPPSDESPTYEEDVLPGLHRLAQSFPNQPCTDAAILRYMSAHQIPGTNRDEEKRPASQPGSDHRVRRSTKGNILPQVSIRNGLHPNRGNQTA